ncbi:MAG: Fe-S cluster assembly protein SufD [Legionellales bacterium]|nr:Fe-S cluster assembly protein SufD [Legionellales bacterium]
MIEAYIQEYHQITPSLTQPLWLKQWRDEALQLFSQQGFPTPHHEDWKYTRVTPILKQHFLRAPVSHSTFPPSSSLHGEYYRLTFCDGHLQKHLSDLNHLPAEIIICDRETAYHHYPQIMQHYLTPHSSHAFGLLNAALSDQGAFIFLPRHTVLDKPLLLHFIHTQSHTATHLRNLIIAEENSQATIIEQYDTQQPTLEYFTNTITEVFAEKNARIQQIKLQLESSKAFHIGHLVAKQAENSEVNSYSFSLGGSLVRSDTSIFLAQAHATTQLMGLYLGKNYQHIDHHTTIEHVTSHCTSSEHYKGILADHAHGVFNGKVIVHPHAQKSHAQQMNNNILLSANAQIDTKPQLEIFADDVKCTHGATIGQLDEDALFYLQSRGVEQAAAHAMLLSAFSDDIINAFPNTALREFLQEKINYYLTLGDHHVQS